MSLPSLHALTRSTPAVYGYHDGVYHDNRDHEWWPLGTGTLAPLQTIDRTSAEYKQTRADALTLIAANKDVETILWQVPRHLYWDIDFVIELLKIVHFAVLNRDGRDENGHYYGRYLPPERFGRLQPWLGFDLPPEFVWMHDSPEMLELLTGEMHDSPEMLELLTGEHQQCLSPDDRQAVEEREIVITRDTRFFPKRNEWYRRELADRFDFWMAVASHGPASYLHISAYDAQVDSPWFERHRAHPAPGVVRLHPDIRREYALNHLELKSIYNALVYMFTVDREGTTQNYETAWHSKQPNGEAWSYAAVRSALKSMLQDRMFVYRICILAPHELVYASDEIIADPAIWNAIFHNILPEGLHDLKAQRMHKFPEVLLPMALLEDREWMLRTAAVFGQIICCAVAFDQHTDMTAEEKKRRVELVRDDALLVFIALNSWVDTRGKDGPRKRPVRELPMQDSLDDVDSVDVHLLDGRSGTCWQEGSGPGFIRSRDRYEKYLAPTVGDWHEEGGPRNLDAFEAPTPWHITRHELWKEYWDKLPDTVFWYSFMKGLNGKIVYDDFIKRCIFRQDFQPYLPTKNNVVFNALAYNQTVADRALVLKAVTVSGRMLQYAEPSLRNDLELRIIAAVSGVYPSMSEADQLLTQFQIDMSLGEGTMREFFTFAQKFKLFRFFFGDREFISPNATFKEMVDRYLHATTLIVEKWHSEDDDWELAYMDDEEFAAAMPADQQAQLRHKMMRKAVRIINIIENPQNSTVQPKRVFEFDNVAEEIEEALRARRRQRIGAQRAAGAIQTHFAGSNGTYEEAVQKAFAAIADNTLHDAHSHLDGMSQ